MAQKLLRFAVVGHVAAALAGDEDLLAGLFHVLQHRHLVPLPHSSTRRHQPGRTAAHDQHLCHPASSCVHALSKLVLLYHTRIGFQMQSLPGPELLEILTQKRPAGGFFPPAGR